MESERKINHSDTDELARNLAWLQTLSAGLFVVGMIALYAPFYASLAIRYQLGILFVVSGGMFLVHAFPSRKWDGFVAEFLIGAIYSTAGILLFAYPIGDAPALTLFVGVALFLKGILPIVYSRHLHKDQNRQWMLANGTISLLVGAIVLAGLSNTAGWAVEIFVGMDLMFSALSIFMVCHAVREILSEGSVSDAIS